MAKFEGANDTDYLYKCFALLRKDAEARGYAKSHGSLAWCVEIAKNG